MDGDFFMQKQKHSVGMWVELALLLVLALCLAWGTALERKQQDLSGRLIRLHVVANSDSQRDQNIKMNVRDAVLREAEEIMATAKTQTEAKELLRAQLTSLEETANQTLSALGCTQPARVSLRRELFGTRTYETFSLPGGYYDALRVEIGNGQGKNWWCVVYPQLCSAATTDGAETVAAMGGLSREQAGAGDGETPEYQFKFKALELLEDLLGWFRGGEDGIPVSG